MESIGFMLHDFGYRGVEVEEAAGVGGMAHLVNFMGTDTTAANSFANEYYNPEVAYKMYGFSVPASEHSVACSWGRDMEEAYFLNMLAIYPEGIVSIVSDTYDVYKFVKTMATKYKDKILARDGKVVFRPDSGDPTSTVLSTLRNLEKGYGSTKNSKGYKVLNNVRVIQGDGIDERAIAFILQAMKLNKWSAENIAFGMGGALLQHSNRDTFKFAMKASAGKDENGWYDIWKSPKSDMGKASKKGRFTLVFNKETGQIYTGNTNGHPYLEDMMETVFENGRILKEYTWDEVRANAEASTRDIRRNSKK